VEAKEEFDNLLNDDSLSNIPIVVLGNKIDKSSAINEQETRDFFNIHNFNLENVNKVVFIVNNLIVLMNFLFRM
jgi:hypothetical protein